jgi:hypothetical protein
MQLHSAAPYHAPASPGHMSCDGKEVRLGEPRPPNPSPVPLRRRACLDAAITGCTSPPCRRHEARVPADCPSDSGTVSQAPRHTSGSDPPALALSPPRHPRTQPPVPAAAPGRPRAPVAGPQRLAAYARPPLLAAQRPHASRHLTPAGSQSRARRGAAASRPSPSRPRRRHRPTSSAAVPLPIVAVTAQHRCSSSTCCATRPLCTR